MWQSAPFRNEDSGSSQTTSTGEHEVERSKLRTTALNARIDRNGELSSRARVRRSVLRERRALDRSLDLLSLLAN